MSGWQTRETRVLPGAGVSLRIGSQGRVPIRMELLYPAFGKYFGYA